MSNTIQIATGARSVGFCLSTSALGHGYGALRSFAKPASGIVVRGRMTGTAVKGTPAWRPPV